MNAVTARPFSPATRADNLDRLARQVFDLLVIGGGITGAGVAREAAARGLKVALVEREDFASGTSSRSSRLIHGGIRYLAQGEFGLVREAGRERTVLRHQAPHLAEPTPVLVPVWRPHPPARIRVGLLLYDRLAGVPPAYRHRMLGPADALAREPGLRAGGLVAAGAYWEFVTDDARLTLETALDAHARGAVLVNHAPAVALLMETAPGGAGAERVVGATVRDAETGRTVDVRARLVVNAAGPWVDRVLGLARPGLRPATRITKGIHLVFPRRRLPVRHKVVAPGPDRRLVFVVPYGPWTYVGTTDTDYTGPLEAPDADPESVTYLLDTVNTAFPAVDLAPGDVTAAWAGLRPLMNQPGRRPEEVSRRDELRLGPPGLLTVYGGKLTTYRRMAHRVVRAALAELGRGPADGPVHAGLPGGNFPGGEGPAAFQAWTAAIGADAERMGLDPGAGRRLGGRYGARAAGLLRHIREEPGLAAPLAPGCAALAAEVAFTVREEMALSLADVLDRRLGLLLFDGGNGLDAAPAAADLMAKLLGWTPERREAELRAYEALVRRHRVAA